LKNYKHQHLFATLPSYLCFQRDTAGVMFLFSNVIEVKGLCYWPNRKYFITFTSSMFILL